MTPTKTLKKFVKCHIALSGATALTKGCYYEVKYYIKNTQEEVVQIKDFICPLSAIYFLETKICNLGHKHRDEEVVFWVKHKTKGFVDFISEIKTSDGNHINYIDPSLGQNAGSIKDFLCEEEEPVEAKEEGISTYIINYITDGIGYKITRKVPNTEPKRSHDSNRFVKSEVQVRMCGYRGDLEEIIRKCTFVTDVTKVAIESFYVPKRPKSHTSIPDSYTYEEFANFHDTHTTTYLDGPLI